jgi:hypothetical protein
LTASAGYQNYGVKVGEDVSFVPVLGGGKFAIGKGVYAHPQVGYSFLLIKLPAVIKTMENSLMQQV